MAPIPAPAQPPIQKPVQLPVAQPPAMVSSITQASHNITAIAREYVACDILSNSVEEDGDVVSSPVSSHTRTQAVQQAILTAPLCTIDGPPLQA